MHWNEGYHTDITYTYGYYGENNPLLMRFLLSANGIVPPEVTCACELGYGQGMSLNILSAAESTAWYGTDFNPAQVSFAQQLAKVSGAHCYGDSFQDFLRRSDLPDFDFIAVHGIWSWISPAAQNAILAIIDQKLRPGGVLYISYNSYPGWAAFLPLRDLMKLYVDCSGHGPTREKARQAFEFGARLLGLNSAYANTNPEVKSRIEMFAKKDPTYLAHEFLNDIWELNSFADMAAKLSEVRLTFACSAQPLLAMPGAGLNQEQQEFLQGIADPVLRETALDFLRNTQFRKDYWIKGRRASVPSERMADLREQYLVALAPMEKFQKQVKMDNAAFTLADAAHMVFTSVLADGRPHTLGELEKAAQELTTKPNAPEGADKENINTLARAAVLLMAANLLGAAQGKSEITKARVKTEKFNALIESRAIDTNEIQFLASPVLGGGLAVGRFEQLFLLAYGRGARTADVMGSFACNALLAVGQRLTENDAAMEPDAMRVRFQEMAAKFLIERLPLLKNLQVV